MNIWTHTGYVKGVDSRTSGINKKLVKLRETKTLWISQEGLRFSKKLGGYGPGEWPMWKLETESIKFSDKDYRTTLIHDAFKNALSYSIGNSLIGMTAVCLEPYHKHSHPLSIVWKGDQHAL